MNRATTACLIASMFLSAANAQDVPPPPKPDNGPSLEVTMKYIVDRLTATEAAWEWQYRGESGPVDYKVNFKVIDALADPKTCNLTFRARMDGANDVSHDEKPSKFHVTSEFSESVREIGKVEVSPQSETVPSTYALSISLVPGRICQSSNNGKFTNGDCVWNLRFQSEEIANRVAKAIVHAVELCGGGDKDPFK